MKWGEPVCERCNALENAQDERYKRKSEMDGGLSEYRFYDTGKTEASRIE
jgi:hypothetical protein